MIRISAITFTLLISTLALADEPGAQIERFQNALLSAGLQQSATYDERYHQLEPIVDATHDLDFIARLTVGRYWADLDADQRTRFKNLFRQLSIASYAGHFQKLDGVTFDILESIPQPRDKMLVRARLTRADATPLAFDYVLHETPQGWRIVNILVDGVSDLALKRAEYAKWLSAGDVSGLFDALEDQIRQLVEKN